MNRLSDAARPEAGAENPLATPKRSSVPQSEALASAGRAWRGKGAGLLLTAGPDAAAGLLEGTVVVSLWHRVGAAHRSTGRTVLRNNCYLQLIRERFAIRHGIAIHAAICSVTHVAYTCLVNKPIDTVEVTTLHTEWFLSPSVPAAWAWPVVLQAHPQW